MILPWIVLPLIGALIGWWTNRVAIWMLFHPREPVNLLGYRWQGVIPSRREQLADNLAGALNEHLLTPEDTQALLDAIPFEQHLDRVVTQTLQKQIPRELLTRIPMMESAREKMIDVLRNQILQRLPKRLSELDEKLLERVTDEIDIAGHIRTRLRELPLDDLEALVWRVAHRELVSIELAGAGIGLLIGLVQAAFIALWQGLG